MFTSYREAKVLKEKGFKPKKLKIRQIYYFNDGKKDAPDWVTVIVSSVGCNTVDLYCLQRKKSITEDKGCFINDAIYAPMLEDYFDWIDSDFSISFDKANNLFTVKVNFSPIEFQKKENQNYCNVLARELLFQHYETKLLEVLLPKCN